MSDVVGKLEKILLNDRFAAAADIRLVSVGGGEAVAEMEISDKHLNGVDIVQGGALFSLADFAFAAASNSCGRIAVAANASINFFKGISSGKLTAVAKQCHSGKTLATYVVEVIDDHGSKVALFTATAFMKAEY